MLNEYKTVLNQVSEEITDKKSKFISSVCHVVDEESALEFIKGVRTKYRDAAHNVFAYYIENSVCVQKFSDDGEPQGTAGLPVLDVIRKLDLKNIVIVVTRYFGGILLGTAGLIRAYSRSALKAVTVAEVVRKKLCILANYTVEYTLLGKIRSRLIESGFTIKGVEYGQHVEISLYIPVDELEKCTAIMCELTNGKAIIETGRTSYIAFKDMSQPKTFV